MLGARIMLRCLHSSYESGFTRLQRWVRSEHHVARDARRVFCAAAVFVVAFSFVPVGATTATSVTQSYGFDSDTLQSFTVPANVTSLSITALGGQGAWGGADSSGNPPAGGYQGEVTGTVSVTPGDYVTIAVGAGADEPLDIACTAGRDETSPVDAYDSAAGENPLSQYDGGIGGAPGYNGCSGYGGAGGAGTVIGIGSSSSSPASIGTIVAGGGGGDGGSGQYSLVRGQIGLASYVAPSAPAAITYGIPAGCTTNCTSYNTIKSPSPLPTTATQGQAGVAVFTMCGGDTNGSSADQFFNTGAPNSEAGCDGGGGAGGGGGAAGGSAGNVQFGSGSSDEWYGQGGSPGENSTGGLAGLNAEYAYYSDEDTGVPTGTDTFADPGTGFDGSVQITYSTGVPSTPSSVTGTAGNTNVALQWSAPSAPGLSAMDDYIVQYSSNGGSSWTTVDTGSTSTSATISGLTNGTGYIFEVQAVNSIGSGPFSTQSGTLTPSGPPGAPTISSLTPEDGAIGVNFTPPASNSPITGYLYQLNGSGPWLPIASTTSSLTISGLADGTSYSVEIEAVNSIGAGAASNSMSQTPVALPGAPTITSVQVGTGTASIAFSPGSTGGSSLTGYRYSTNGGSTWTTTSSTTSPLSLTGLANGTSYSFELEAINTSGDSVATSTSFTTPSVPSAPVITAVNSQNQALQVNFTPPTSTGSPITGYDWSSDGGTTWYSEGSFGTPCQIAPGGSSETCEISALSTNGSTTLTNGTTYSVELRAVNGVGTGAASNASSGTPYTTPGAPTITTGQSGMIPANQTLIVSFSAPASTGGTAITSYQYSTDAGATWQSRTDGQAATATTMTISSLSSDGVTPLTNGETYPIEIRAVNAEGDSQASSPVEVAPASVPSAPSVTLTPGDGAISVSTSVSNNGGSPVLGVDYSLDGAPFVSTGTTSSTFTIPGLTNGTSYSVSVRDDNAIGNGVASTPQNATPITVPGAPIEVVAASDSASADVSWSASAINGGSAITGYTATAYTSSAGTTAVGTPCTTTSLACSITGLTNGTTYYIGVVATNAAGSSVASNPLQAVTPVSRPSAPRLTGITAGDSYVAVPFTAGAAGGDPITSYQYSLNGGTTWANATGTTSPLLIDGLSDGTSYTVSIRAVSAAGPGAVSNTETATPYTYPSPVDPTTIYANAENNQIAVSWTVPSDQGSVITEAQATAFSSLTGGSQEGNTCTTTTNLAVGDTTSCIITGLTNGTTYYISIQSENAAGWSARSTPRVPATPDTLPGAPTGLTASSGNASATLTVTPGSQGSSAITDYLVDESATGTGGWSQVLDPHSSSPTISVTGLTNGDNYYYEVFAENAQGVSASASEVAEASPIAPGTVPTTSTPVPTATGFTFSITNYSGATTYALSTTAGSVSRNGSTVTVTGLTTNGTAQITIQASAFGDTTTQATATGNAYLSGTAPTYSAPSPTSTGFGFTIANYSSDDVYTFSATNGAVVSAIGDEVTVTGLTLGQSSTITTTAAATGYVNASSTLSGSALVAGVQPTFSVPTQLSGGFSVSITNYAAGSTYTFAATDSASVSESDGVITVSGIGAGDSSAVTVTVAEPGSTTASAVVVGSASLEAPTTIGVGNDSTSLASSLTAPIAGEAETLTATVDAQGLATSTPTGTVDFEDGGVSVAGCSAVSLGNGVATCTTTLPVGENDLSANYSGNGVFVASTGSESIMVMGAPNSPSNLGVVFSSSGNGSTGSAEISWSPSSSGSSGVTYTVMVEPTGQTCTTSGTSCTIAGLSPGQPYSFVVEASNAAGMSAPEGKVTLSPVLETGQQLEALGSHVVPVDVTCQTARCIGVANVTVARRLYRGRKQVGWEHLVLAQGTFNIAAGETAMIKLTETQIGRSVLPSQTKWWFARTPTFRMTLTASVVDSGTVMHAPTYLRSLLRGDKPV